MCESPLSAAAVLEQPRIVGRDALQQRFHHALDLGIAGRCVAEQGAVVDQRSDQVENQLEVDALAQIATLRARARAPP